MSTWKHHVVNALNCLESVTHLLKEEHVTCYVPAEQNDETDGNVSAFDNVSNAAYGNDSNGKYVAQGNGQFEDNDHDSLPIVRMSISEDSIGMQDLSKQGFVVDPLNENGSSIASNTSSMTSNAVDMNKSFQSCTSSPESHSSAISIKRNSEELPEWFKVAPLGGSNLLPASQLINGSSNEIDIAAAQSSSTSPVLPVIRAGIRAPTPPARPPTPYRSFISLRREDPVAFHLDAFDSPPPSPRREEEDFAENMQVDPNGAIPVFPENFSEEPELPILGIDRFRAFGCPLEYCNSFEQFLVTTEENVKDKKNILKEMFNHVIRLLKKAAEEGPTGKMEDFIDLSASVALIHNSFGSSEDVASFQRFAATATQLVSTVQTALQRHVLNDSLVITKTITF